VVEYRKNANLVSDARTSARDVQSTFQGRKERENRNVLWKLLRPRTL
jgi:hypothetical protein